MNTFNNSNEYDYRKFIVDDDDDDDYDDYDNLNNCISDTSWITEYENKIMNDDYYLFLKSDVTRIKFEFLYLGRDKRVVERVVPFTYSLRQENKINQDEIFSIVKSRQYIDKKYYNFHSLLLYSFDFHDNSNDVIRSLSNYIKFIPEENTTDIKKSFIEYTNLLSIDVIHFTPLIAMFHEFIGFSVLLYED